MCQTSIVYDTVKKYTQNMLSAFTAVLYLASVVNSLPEDLINTIFTKQIDVTGISSDPLSSVREVCRTQCAGFCLALDCTGFV